VVYMSGFFITVSPEAIGNVAKHVAENDKILCMVRGVHHAWHMVCTRAVLHAYKSGSCLVGLCAALLKGQNPACDKFLRLSSVSVCAALHERCCA